jgi:hypothetical protein
LGSIPFFNQRLYGKALGNQEHKVMSSGTFAETNNAGFHQWGYPNSWLVYKRTSSQKSLGDLGGPP